MTGKNLYVKELKIVMHNRKPEVKLVLSNGDVLAGLEEVDIDPIRAGELAKVTATFIMYEDRYEGQQQNKADDHAADKPRPEARNSGDVESGDNEQRQLEFPDWPHQQF